MLLRLMFVLMALVLAHGLPVDRGDTDTSTQLIQLKALVEDLKNTTQDQAHRLSVAEKELKELKDVPKVAFTASLGGNGMVKSLYGNKALIYKDIITNVGEAYNSETGMFTAPVNGVYYVRFTANGPNDGAISAVLYKGYEQLLIVHEQPSGEGSDTASNGATLQLVKGEQLHMKLWHNTQIWDNSNRHSTFTAFLLYAM